MKKVISIILAAALTCTMLAGCSGSKYKSVDQLKKSGTLTMTTNATFPPFEYVADGGKVVGVDPDIAQAIADKLGVQLKIDNVEFNGALTAVSSGKADMAIAGITITDKRKKSMDFSDPYTTSVQYIIVKDSENSIKTIEDLAGKKIGVQLGTTGDLICTDEVNGYKDEDKKDVKGVLQDTNAKVVTYKSSLEAALDMQNGNVDAVIIDALPAQNIVQANSGLKCFELVYKDGSNTQEQYAIAVAKGNEELLKVINEVLAELKTNGKLDEFILNHTGAASISK